MRRIALIVVALVILVGPSGSIGATFTDAVGAGMTVLVAFDPLPTPSLKPEPPTPAQPTPTPLVDTSSATPVQSTPTTSPPAAPSAEPTVTPEQSPQEPGPSTQPIH